MNLNAIAIFYMHQLCRANTMIKTRNQLRDRPIPQIEAYHSERGLSLRDRLILANCISFHEKISGPVPFLPNFPSVFFFNFRSKNKKLFSRSGCAGSSASPMTSTATGSA